jgi:hypothetical protein
MVYKWRPGFQFAGKADPEKVAIEINGGATTNELYKIAKRKTSELHKCVTWDKDKAAQAHQLAQIRNAVNHLVVVTVVKNQQGQKSEVLMPYAESVGAEEGKRRYVVAHDMEDDDLNYVIERKAAMVASISVELSVYRGRRKSMAAAISKLEEAKDFMLRAEGEKDKKNGKDAPKVRRALAVAAVT